FPEICLACNNFLFSGEKTVCTLCRHNLPLTNFHENKDNSTLRIFHGKVQIENACSFLWFHKNSIVQQLIHNLKYKNHEEIGSFLGSWYGTELSKSNFYENKIDL